MPRSPRLDAPGLLHHVMCRGIENQPIFMDDTDRQNLISRLAALVQPDQTEVYAFVLMPNHLHLLTRTLRSPLPRFVGRLLTGYAMYFNRRHDRKGHLFQNRYKSIIVDEQSYLLELIRYIHLNPIRTGAIADLKSLQAWPFSGHAALMGERPSAWLSIDGVLSLFGPSVRLARQGLLRFMKEGLSVEKDHGGVRQPDERKVGIPGDGRILGDDGFAAKVLDMLAQPKPPPVGGDIDQLLRMVAGQHDLTVPELCSGSKRAPVVGARRKIIRLATQTLGISAKDLATLLGVQPVVIYKTLTPSRQANGRTPDRINP